MISFSFLIFVLFFLVQVADRQFRLPMLDLRVHTLADGNMHNLKRGEAEEDAAGGQHAAVYLSVRRHAKPRHDERDG